MARADGDLRNIFIGQLGQFDWARVESPITPGIPDSNACGLGSEFWLEFKRTSTWTVDLDPLQVSWIHRRWRAGGRVWVAVWRSHGGGPRRGDAVSDLYLVYGANVRELKQNGLRLDPSLVTASWRGGPERWDWLRISQILAGDGSGTTKYNFS